MLRAPRPALAAGAVAFVLVAILNCGGYRYGIGDQAFYVPAVVQHFDPQFFPRDRAMLHVQDRLTLYDEVLAAAARTTRASLPTLFFAAYVGGLVLLFGAAVSIGRSLFASWWAVMLLVALLTLRHRITQTGANSLEAYFQPRMLAFALGALAVAAYLRRHHPGALLALLPAFVLHPTTASWFAVWIGVAMLVTEPRWRAPLGALAAAAIALACWAVAAGPLEGHLVRMDPLWASALAGKDYIFPSDWNASFWLVNFGYLAVAGLVYAWRRTRGVTVHGEAGLLLGGVALAALFLLSWPLMESGIALALQLQTSRVFWLLDFLAAIYIAWALAEGPRSVIVRRAAVACVLLAALARGGYVWAVEQSGNPLVQLTLPRDTWTDAMDWIATSPRDAHVLADPGHAWKYGSSVRVAGERDVFLEEVKDLALALYSRNVAMTALDRIEASRNFGSLTPAELLALAARYDLDFVVVDRRLDLPEAYRNDRFFIYDLR